MNKIFTRVIGGALGLAMAVGVGVSVFNANRSFSETMAESSETNFTSKAWAGNSGYWVSNKDGGQLSSGRGVQVTTGASGAGATSKKLCRRCFKNYLHI